MEIDAHEGQGGHNGTWVWFAPKLSNTLKNALVVDDIPAHIRPKIIDILKELEET